MDFTFHAYRTYLEAIKARYDLILRFDEFLAIEKKPDSFALIRHDVDRRPVKALDMARLENEMGIRSTYYFRDKPRVFDPSILRAVRRLGHEIGYHYETLSDANGNRSTALEQFEYHLKRLRKHCRIDTISMHGRPLSPYNNLDLWRSLKKRSQLKKVYGISGEIYLDIDYREIAYLSDTGRNWDQTRSNKRDKVRSDIPVELKNGRELLGALRRKRWEKIVFQIHPERWAESRAEHFFQFAKDTGVNLIKKLL